jgi:hypothetical protein
MGSFYVNYTIKGDDPASIARALSGRKAFVSPAQKGYVVVFDEESDNQDQEQIAKLAGQLSMAVRSMVLAVLNHDSDILWYQLYEDGTLSDEYDSTPGYWSSPVLLPPAGGNPEKLCSAFSCNDVAQVGKILRASGDDYREAMDRHADLARALKLPGWALGFGYGAIAQGYFPEGLTVSDLISVG